jgi:hypothetical protein
MMGRLALPKGAVRAKRSHVELASFCFVREHEFDSDIECSRNHWIFDFGYDYLFMHMEVSIYG